FRKPVAGATAPINTDRSEIPVAAGTGKDPRPKNHRVNIGSRGPQTTRLILDCPDQLRSIVLAAQRLLDPEQLDEQHAGPNFPDNPADDLAALAQRNRETLVLLFSHFFVVVTDKPAEHRLLGVSDGALDGNRRHGLAQRDVD